LNRWSFTIIGSKSVLAMVERKGGSVFKHPFGEMQDTNEEQNKEFYKVRG
jgi:hypothetical protein